MSTKYSAKDLGELIIADMKDRGINYIDFIDIEELFREVGYDYRCDDHDCLRLSAFDNVYLWLGWTSEAQDAIKYMMRNGFHMHGIAPTRYYLKGKVPNMPEINKLKSYKKPHWYPIVIERDYDGMKIKDEEIFKEQCAREDNR